MDDYPYATLGADGWFRCDGLDRPGFPTLLQDVLHRFGYTGFPAYRGRPYHQFGLERAAHQALTKFCERHLPVLGNTTLALLPVWSERVTAIGDPEFPTHHSGWTLTARYTQHVSSLLQEVTAMGAHLGLHLEECADQVKAKNHVVKDIQKGNRAFAEERPPGDAHRGAE
jgi:hypothetical protein